MIWPDKLLYKLVRPVDASVENQRREKPHVSVKQLKQLVREAVSPDRDKQIQRDNRRAAAKIFALHKRLFDALERADEAAEQLNAVPDVNRYYSQHGGEIIEDVQEGLRAIWSSLTKGDAEQTEITWT